MVIEQQENHKKHNLSPDQQILDALQALLPLQVSVAILGWVLVEDEEKETHMHNWHILKIAQILPLMKHNPT